jgi:adenylate cyclase
MFKFKSLRRRLLVFLIIPVVLFLGASGFIGYHYIRDSLVKEWQQIAVLRLERAAHQMDMRLRLPRQWMEAYAKAGNKEIEDWTLQQLKKQEGVEGVYLTWAKARPGEPEPGKVLRMSVIEYFYPPGQKTVGLRGELLDAANQPVGRLEVLVSYQYLMHDIIASGWMQAQMACLVNVEGHYLAHSSPMMKNRHCLGETQDPLELAMLKAMKSKPYDTIVGGGLTPDRVIGYYRLHAAPWAIMLHAQGSEILAPILRFRLYFMAASLMCLAVILVLLHIGVRPLVSAIRSISLKAVQVAQGNYGEPLPVQSPDEMGQLTSSFNEMVAGLKERDFISNTFGRYVDKEIAQELLARPEAARLGGEKREVVILFSDIRGFTPLAETLSPEATIKLVNHHFSEMIEVIQQHRGIIVDFLGDAILAFFDPLDGPITPAVRRAIRCGLKMQSAVIEDNLAQPKALVLQMGVGLHVGEVVVGNIGSESRAKYGIVGSAVNLTHRIQGQAKGGEVVISEPTYQKAGPGLRVQKTFESRLKGIQEPVALYVVADVAAI